VKTMSLSYLILSLSEFEFKLEFLDWISAEPYPAKAGPLLSIKYCTIHEAIHVIKLKVKFGDATKVNPCVMSYRDHAANYNLMKLQFNEEKKLGIKPHTGALLSV
jgi:hypothetical protein